MFTHRTNRGKRHFMSQNLTYSSSTYLSIKNGNEVKIRNNKPENCPSDVLELNSETDIQHYMARPRNKLHMRNEGVRCN